MSIEFQQGQMNDEVRSMGHKKTNQKPKPGKRPTACTWTRRFILTCIVVPMTALASPEWTARQANEALVVAPENAGPARLDERSMGQIRGRGAVHAEVEASGTIAVILWDEAPRPPKGSSSYSQAIGTNVVQQNNFSLQRN